MKNVRRYLQSEINSIKSQRDKVLFTESEKNLVKIENLIIEFEDVLSILNHQKYYRRKFNDYQVRSIIRLHNKQVPITEICKIYDCDHKTIQDVINEKGAYAA